jgi:hypothetical protein
MTVPRTPNPMLVAVAVAAAASCVAAAAAPGRWPTDRRNRPVAARGYVVLYPGDDYEDLMVGVDELVRRGLVDARRLQHILGWFDKYRLGRGGEAYDVR